MPSDDAPDMPKIMPHTCPRWCPIHAPGIIHKMPKTCPIGCPRQPQTCPRSYPRSCPKHASYYAPDMPHIMLQTCPRWCPRHAPDDGPVDSPDIPLSIIFDSLEAPAFKYSTWWVFSALYLAVFGCTWRCLGLPWSTLPLKCSKAPPSKLTRTPFWVPQKISPKKTILLWLGLKISLQSKLIGSVGWGVMLLSFSEA